MPEPTRPITSSHGFWQSLEELVGDSSFLQRFEQEFCEEASEPLDGVSRRRILQLMSASVALAGLSGCRWPEEEIIPFDRRPESYQPGKLTRYATTLEVAGVVTPVVVSSFDGRPIKIEGNPDHPLSGGRANALTQASILELHDRDRSRQPKLRQGEIARRATWPEFTAAIPQLIAGQGERAAVLSQPVRSPTLERVALRLQGRYPRLRWYEFAAGSDTNQVRGLEKVFGHPIHLSHDLEQARVIVDFDADLLVGHPEGVRNARGFARARTPDPETMGRLYVFESVPSATGSAADHRVPLAPSQIVTALAALAARLQRSDGLVRPEALADLDTATARQALAGAGMESLAATLEAVAEDLLHNTGQALVALGDRHPDAAHSLVHRINLALGNDQGPIRYGVGRKSPLESGTIDVLAKRLQEDEIDCLFILDGNPIFDAPADLGFATALRNVDRSVHLGLHENETAAACHWHLPMAHGLESWGDLWDLEGRVCAVQPLIRPLFDGRTPSELLSMIADATPMASHDMVQETLRQLDAGTDGPAPMDWRRFLHKGLVDTDATQAAEPDFSDPTVGAGLDDVLEGVGSEDGLELDLRPDSSVHDGRYANNAWLQELPDAISKLTWGNAALLGPSLADEMGLAHEDVVRLETGADAIELPVFVLPGMAKDTISVSLGYGRTRAGRVGTGIGVDAFAIQTWTRRWSQNGVKLSATGRQGALASTQNHYAIDSRGKAERERRIDALVREGTLADFEHHPEFAQHMGVHHPPLKSLWTEREGEGHQWGMAIDLNACIACNSCVVACQAENNIPVVGKEEVLNGREMHWIRIDRYFHGDPDTAGMAHQPVACSHCELAPCEQVCPVAATLHSDEGLNVMAYNRCVGTRYCANNCPYKVRRFNFFNFNKDITDLEKLRFNPEVTIRARGVMEKCTYCVQRIEHARIDAKNEGRELRDGDVVTACQQTCPSEAITFGDLSDPESRVSRLHADPRAYALLAELNIKPRTVYLARIRNPHPDLASAQMHDAPTDDGHAKPRDSNPEGGHHG